MPSQWSVRLTSLFLLPLALQQVKSIRDDADVDDDVFGASLTTDEKQETEQTSLKTVAGVPIYDYEWAHTEHHVTSLVETTSTAHWIVSLKDERCGDEESRLDLCMPKGGLDKTRLTCVSYGRCWIAVRCSEADLNITIDTNKKFVAYVEPDLELAETTYADNSAPKTGIFNPTADITSIRLGVEHLQAIGDTARTSQGEGVRVYVVDSGVFTSHLEFGGRAIPGSEIKQVDGFYQATDCDDGDHTCAQDERGHGTHCAGLVAGSRYGVAPKATMIAVKIYTTGSAPSSYLMSSLEWVQQDKEIYDFMYDGTHPAVVSMSIGGLGLQRSARKAVESLVDAGITVVVAAGNEKADDSCISLYPSSEKVITVGATDSGRLVHGKHDKRADFNVAGFSNQGKCVDIFAPGVKLRSAEYRTSNKWQAMSGTSMATPMVAGAAALILGDDNSLSPSEVKGALIADARRGVVKGLSVEGTPNVMLHVGPEVNDRHTCLGWRKTLKRQKPSYSGECFCQELKSTNVKYYCFDKGHLGCPSGTDGSGLKSSDTFHYRCATCRCIRKKCPPGTTGPDRNGDCTCAANHICFKRSNRGCPTSASGSNYNEYEDHKFSLGCKECKCHALVCDKPHSSLSVLEDPSSGICQCDNFWDSDGYLCFDNGRPGCLLPNGKLDKDGFSFSVACSTCKCAKYREASQKLLSFRYGKSREIMGYDGDGFCSHGKRCYDDSNGPATDIGCPTFTGGTHERFYSADCTECRCESVSRTQCSKPNSKHAAADWDGNCECAGGYRCYKDATTTDTGCLGDGKKDTGSYSASCARCMCEKEPRLKIPCPSFTTSKFADWNGLCECPSGEFVTERCYSTSDRSESGPVEDADPNDCNDHTTFPPTCTACVCKG